VVRAAHEKATKLTYIASSLKPEIWNWKERKRVRGVKCLDSISITDLGKVRNFDDVQE
jgi:hypothetical protein